MRLLFVLALIPCCLAKKWVDPHDMDGMHQAAPKVLQQQEAVQYVTTSVKAVNFNWEQYMKRLVRLILTNAYLDKEDPSYYKGHLNMHLSPKQFDFLMSFSQNPNSLKLEDLLEASSIFETAFSKTSFDKYQEFILSVQERLYYMCFNSTTASFVGAVLVLFITYKLLKAQFNWRDIFLYFIVLGYVIDFAITYLLILKVSL